MLQQAYKSSHYHETLEEHKEENIRRQQVPDYFCRTTDVQEDSRSEFKMETHMDKTYSIFGGKTDDSPLLLYCDASAMEREVARAVNLNARKNTDLAKAGIFNYETYNAILNMENPNALLTTGQTFTKKSVQQMIDETFWLPFVEEIDDNMGYEELSVMRHPAQLHHYETYMSK
ncbi:unnamed protein product [Cylicocyclus nassatus]|uniref:Uncharacterized protein n=1 Tax=Cylicocyclus nassatus TaxID=53992 RepID=A0AA36HCI9_CYLNA|nr:unnamed protein product [Cylicocyclus nassatus]